MWGLWFSVANMVVISPAMHLSQWIDNPSMPVDLINKQTIKIGSVALTGV